MFEKELTEGERRLERLLGTLETGELGLAYPSLRIQQLRHRRDQPQATQADLEQILPVCP